MMVTFNPLRVMIMIYSLAKVQRQRSVGSQDTVDTKGQTEVGYCIISLANAVGKNRNAQSMTQRVQALGGHGDGRVLADVA